ncbi:MAG: hypothetical protein EOP88_00040 [Verrucomicrobiaceae bacterium]|nr:MAG: hypothetical protein EOP88_00040 [Verrucomicrobiaceae bacterium]
MPSPVGNRCSTGSAAGRIHRPTDGQSSPKTLHLPDSMNLPALSQVLARVLVAHVVLTSLAAAQSGLDQPQPFAPYLNGVFPANPPGSTPGGSWTTQNAFPALNFPEPVRIVEHPRENKLVVVSKTGPIWIFDSAAATTTKQVLLDLTSVTNHPDVGEGGVTGFAFHPDFGVSTSPNRGYIYVAYRHTPGKTGIQLPEQSGFNRISRFTVPDGGTAATLGSELILINQYDRQQWHIGGDMFFGTDGFLYIGVGDEGQAFSRIDATQRVDGGLWSGILRIDVNNDPALSAPIARQPKEAFQINNSLTSLLNPRPASWPVTSSQGYSIPLDNPFRTTAPAGGGQAATLGEFYAIGLRHPWSISQDPVTGHIWYADVGEDQREEIGRIVKGGNHQWGFKEGSDYNGPIVQPASLLGTSTAPILDYSHVVGKAVIGAGVYRGALFPELQGKFLFSDFNDGQFWAIDASQNGPIAIRSKSVTPAGVQFITQLPAGFSAGINAFCLMKDGRVLMAKTAGGAKNGGTLLGLVRQGTPSPQPPALLSQTGAFSNLTSLTPAAGLIPYSLVVPFWSDNAQKSRWVGIPNDGTHNTAAEKITTTADGDLNLPVGSVTVKHFEMAMDQRNPSVTKRLETRFLIHGTGGWYGVTYRWNTAGTDAELLYDTQTLTLAVTDTAGQVKNQVWTYPGRTQCMTCHTPAAGTSLGLMTRQLNKDHFYPLTGRTANQLVTLSALGILQTPVAVADLPNLPTLKATADAGATLEQRARSWLDSNCSYCHQPGGVRAAFDARYTTPLASAGILNGTLAESLGIAGAAVISPGSLTKSIIHHRAASVGEGHSMPPLAKDMVDTAGVAVLADWIYSLAPVNGLGTATLGNNTATTGNFSDAHHPSLFVNKSDTYTNNTAAAITVSLANFSFHATKKGNPLTPFVATVSGTDSFTISAIGTTRPASSYQVGANDFLFSSSGSNKFSVAPGSTIVTGFMDCLPDGSGWGGGSVIPAATGAGNAEDDVWALLPEPLVLQTVPYSAGVATPSITLGQTIAASNAGKALKIYPNLQRSYKFAVSYSLSTDPPPVTPPVTPPVGGTVTELVVNGSFEDTNPKPTTWLRVPTSGVTGWTTSSPEKLIEVWKSGFLNFSAVQGGQIVELDGATLEQTLPTTPGATLTWSFYHRGRDGNDTMALDIGPAGSLTRVKTATTGKNAWVKYEGTYVVPAGQTLTKIIFVPISAASSLIAANLIDQVSVKQDAPVVLVDTDGDGVPDASDAFPNDPAETKDTDGDGVGDNADPFPNDPYNGNPPLVSELITNGSFENTTPKPTTYLMLPQASVPGWKTASPAGTIEIWKSNFMNVPAQQGIQFSEMDGQTLEQTLPTVPGASLAWSFHHRGREGFDTVALDIGTAPNVVRAGTFSTGKTAWLKYQGSYVVPAGQTLTKFTLVPISAASVLTSANFIDNVSVVQTVMNPPDPDPDPEPDRDGDGVPDDEDDFPDDPNESKDTDGDGVGDNADDFPTDPDETTDSDGDGIGDNSDPYPNDPNNGGVPVVSELITNGSFENTTPKPDTWQRIPPSGVPGWSTNSPEQLIEIWKSNFLKVPAHSGGQLAEMDGSTLEQTLTTVPGSTLAWSFHHRGRDGNDTMALDIGPAGSLTRVKTATTGKNAWVKYEGTYIVPAGQTQTRFVLVPISGASSLIAANMLDTVSVIQTTPGTPPTGGNNGITNASFEQNLDGWTYSNVAVVTTPVHAGVRALDLKNGFITQAVGGLVPGNTYTLYLAYRSQAGVTGLLGDAVVSINGNTIGEIHNATEEYILKNGFQFVAPAATVSLRIQSQETGNAGLLIDALRLENGPLPAPPRSTSLVNGSFEDQTGLSGDNPHPTGFELPGWLVTRENVDPIRVAAFAGWTAVQGNWVLDLSGHGPGGIAQTVTGKVPGSLHTLSFSYARHMYWDQEAVLKAEVYANGILVANLERNKQQKVPNWATMSLQVPAATDGTITIEFRSISKLVGGGIIIDNVTLAP